MVQQLLNEVWHCSLLHQIRRCLQLARTHRKWGTMCVNWMWLTTREPYPSCPSDWSRGGAKDQCSGFLSLSLPLSLWNTTNVYPVYNSFTSISWMLTVCAITANWTTCTRCILIRMIVVRMCELHVNDFSHKSYLGWQCVFVCVCVHCSSLDSVMWGPCSFPWCNSVNLLPVLKPAFLWSYETFRTILKIRV